LHGLRRTYIIGPGTLFVGVPGSGDTYMNEVICFECQYWFELTWPGVDATMRIEWTVAGPHKIIVECPDHGEDSVLKQLGV